MKNIKVVIKPSFGSFEMTPEFKAFVESCGYQGIFSIEARTDARIHAFIEDENNQTSVNSWERIRIQEVDASRQWTIMDYDGAEGIAYPAFEMIRPDINYVKEVRQ